CLNLVGAGGRLLGRVAIISGTLAFLNICQSDLALAQAPCLVAARSSNATSTSIAPQCAPALTAPQAAALAAAPPAALPAAHAAALNNGAQAARKASQVSMTAVQSQLQSIKDSIQAGRSRPLTSGRPIGFAAEPTSDRLESNPLYDGSLDGLLAYAKSDRALH